MIKARHAPPLSVVEPGTHWLLRRPSRCQRRPDRSGREVESRNDGLPSFQMRRLQNVATEMGLHVLAYNLKPITALLGTGRLVAALRT